nr:Uncharacterised protein [Providencia rettgeri]
MSHQDRNYILGIPKLPARAMIFLVPFFFIPCHEWNCFAD